MKYILLYSFVVAVLIVTACDCRLSVTGRVIDEENGLPLDSVAIGRTDTVDLNNPFNSKAYTDSNGYFDFSGIAGRCDGVLLYFSKEGYKTKAIKFDNFSIDTIRLIKN